MTPKDKYEYKEKIKTPFPQTIIHLDCPECNTPVKAQNINLDKTTAKCDHCDSIFNFENEMPPYRAKPEVFLPKGIEVLKLRSELEIQYKWRKTVNSGFMTLFTIIWNAMILPFAIGAILSGQIMVLLFMSVHLIAGISLMYNLFSNLLNTTYVSVDENQLSIEHRPLRQPFGGDTYVPVEEIDQVYINRYVSSRTNGVPNYAFGVTVIEKSGKKNQVLKGLKHPDQARYIEQEIEFFLGIDDRKVRGEWKD